MIGFFIFFGAVLGASGRGARPLSLETVVSDHGKTLLNLNNVQNIEPRLKVLKKDDVEAESREIRKQIDEINARLSDGEKKEILIAADETNPDGYMCNNTIIEIKELQFTDQVRCYKEAEEVCSMVHETVFEEKEEKECETHFRKICWIDYEDQATTETVRICNKKPQRVCNLSETELSKLDVMEETKEVYETVCQTRYIGKTVTENKTSCKNVNEKMCMPEGSDNCIPFQRRKCETKEVDVLKQIPKTGCQQHKTLIKYDPLCPLVVEHEVCQDVEKTFVHKKPVEVCEMEPRQVCTNIIKQYPTLQMTQQCDLLPRETCTPERVQPQLVTKPVIKKLCMKL